MGKELFKYGKKEDLVKYANYIELPSHLKKYIIIDIDYEGGCASWIENDLPMPTIAIINRKNFHGLLFYELKTTVAFPIKGKDNFVRSGPIRYFQAVRNAYVKKLFGDMGYTAASCKNPFSAKWYTIWNDVSYTLDDLAEYVKLEIIYNFNKDSDGSYGRHMEMFNSCRFKAYRCIKTCKSFEEFHLKVCQICQEHYESVTLNIPSNHDFPQSEVRSISISIAKWTWNKRNDKSFSQFMKNTGAASLSPIDMDKNDSEYFKTVSNHKSLGAHYTNKVRRSKTEVIIRKSCQQMFDSKLYIDAKTVATQSGLSLPTIYRYKSILNEFIANDIINIMSERIN